MPDDVNNNKLYGFQFSYLWVKIMAFAIVINGALTLLYVSTLTGQWVSLLSELWFAGILVVFGLIGTVIGYIFNILSGFKKRVLLYSLGHLTCLIILINIFYRSMQNANELSTNYESGYAYQEKALSKFKHQFKEGDNYQIISIGLVTANNQQTNTFDDSATFVITYYLSDNIHRRYSSSITVCKDTSIVNFHNQLHTSQ